MPNVQRVEIYGEIEAGTRIIFFKGCFVEEKRAAAAIATALMPSGRRLDFVWYTMVAAAKIMHHHCTARAQKTKSKTAEKRRLGKRTELVLVDILSLTALHLRGLTTFSHLNTSCLGSNKTLQL